jgi:hypothetical protein
MSEPRWQFVRNKGTFLLTSPWGNMATPGGQPAIFMNTSAAIADPLRWRMELRVSRFWFHVVRKHTPKTCNSKPETRNFSLERDFATNHHE